MQPTPEPSPETAGSSPALELTFWHSWNGRAAQVLDVLARRYERGHPGVRIRLEERPAVTLVRDYSEAVADGGAPQMVLVLSRYLGELAENRYVLPLNEQRIDEAVAEIPPGVVDGARIAGRLHSIPLTYDSLVLFYDRRQVAAPPATLADLRSAAPTSATETPDRSWGLAYYLSAATTLPYIEAFGGAVWGPDGGVVLDTEERRPGTLSWLEWLKSLRADTGAQALDDFGLVHAAIQANRAAATVDWLHRLPDYQRVWGADAVGVAALPRPEGDAGVPRTFVLSDLVCINTVTTAQQRAAAIDFALYLASEPAQELLWTRAMRFPAHRDAAVDGAAKDALAASSGAVPFPNTIREARAWPLLDEMVRSVLSGSATPSEALDAAATALRALPARP
ncbi:MAG TPA: extracellular solute-binding protein [Herpetosiphonaceae bacterium]|nr:extracellular solute-binding protein [Herpetosiphonaceae bacterium]